MQPELHLHAHVEFDRSCNRCSNCCTHIFRKKHRRSHSDSNVAYTAEYEEQALKFYLRMKNLIASRFSGLHYSESHIFDIVQLKANVKLYPNKIPSQEEVDRIYEAIEKITEIIKKKNFKESELRTSIDED